jgi:HSP20 family molecular chaperone IbpA
MSRRGRVLTKRISSSSTSGPLLRQFSISETIDQTVLTLMLSDGVLRLTLPKVENAIPRKIPFAADDG